MSVTMARAALALAMLAGGAGAAHADKIKNPTAVFSGLDKITGRIVSFEVAVDETVQFGALQMTPRICYTRPPTESPNTTSFVEVDEVALDNKYNRIFSGWMFAASPGLHGIEHPVYDIWLVDCKGGTEVIAEPRETPPPAPVEQRAEPQSDIMAPPDGPMLEAQSPPPAPVPQPQPRRQPTQRFFPTGPGTAPLINNERTTDR
jgi:hypothetical protein